MYVLLSGRAPFGGLSDSNTLALVQKGQWSFRNKCWTNVSQDAKDLISNLLEMNPRARYSAEEALNNEWIKLQAPRAGDVQLQDDLVQRLCSFQSVNRLKKAALEIVATQLSEEVIMDLRNTFKALDTNGDGQLTIMELTAGLERAGLGKTYINLQECIQGIDADGSGVIDYTEFLAASLDRKQVFTEAVLRTAFNVFDRNGDGQISQMELRDMLSNGGSDLTAGESAKSIMRAIDLDADGSISFDEFVEMMRGQGGSSVPGSPAAAGGA